MTNHHDIINHHADLQGMKDAEIRHGGAMSEREIIEQYRAIQARPLSEVKPYVAPPNQVHIEEPLFTANQKRTIAGGSIIAVVVSICYSIIQAAATGAFNTLFAWIIGGVAGVVVLGGLFGQSGSVRRSDGGGVARGGDNITVNNNITIQR